MIRIYLILLLIILAYYALRKFRKASPAVVACVIRHLLFLVAVAAFIYMGLAGWLGGLLALLGVALTFMLRLMPSLLRNAPYLHQIWQEWLRAKQGQSQRQGHGGSPGKMSVAEAYEVLGLKMGASDQEIIAAHRKLMQKIHPDRGGSDYLAAKINLAKKLLLKR